MAGVRIGAARFRVRGRRRSATLFGLVALAAAAVAPIASPTAASAAPGDISTVAGGCAPTDFECIYTGNSTGDGGPATAAHLNKPYGVAAASGNMFISENQGNRVRKVDSGGTISLLAGGGTPPNGDGGSATDAVLSRPGSVAIDPAGDLLFVDPLPASGTSVRRVDHATGVITTVFTTAGYVFSIAVDAGGRLFVGTRGQVLKVNANGTTTPVVGTGVYGFSGDGGAATAARLNYLVYDMAFDASGSLVLSDTYNHRVRRVAPGADGAVNGDSDEIITTVAGNGGVGTTGDGGPATSASIAYVAGLGLDPSGNLFIAAYGSGSTDNRVRRVDHITGVITTVAGGVAQAAGSGQGGPATAAYLDYPLDVAADGAGNLIIATESAALRKVDASGTITTAAGDATCTPFCQGGFSGDGGPATAARISRIPVSPVFDASGNLVFADGDNHRLRRIDTAGIITTVAGGGVGDGLAATATFVNKPRGVATDASGNVLIADCGDARVRKVDAATGIISTSAGGGTGAAGTGDGIAATSAVLTCPSGLAVAPAGTSVAAGTLFIADCDANKVTKVDPATGKISTVAGTGAAGFSGDNNVATKAKLNCPSDVALDSAGNLVIADTNNSRVRRVDVSSAKINSVGGDGTVGFGTEGATATKTSLSLPQGVAVDGGGNLLVTDGYARVRKVDASTARITTVAGEGIPGFSGDGGPATRAQMTNPTQVRLDGAGNLLITDRGNQRVRQVAAGTPPPPPPPPVSGCGQVITTNTTLSTDIGPCPGDGVVIGADKVTLNLNGHRIFGAGTGGDGTHAGVRIYGHTGVTVLGASSPGPNQGSVTGFDAGVVLFGSSKNTIANLTVADNYGGQGQDSELGDGIALLFSATNNITNDVVSNNGPFDGIGVLGKGSDNNTLKANVVTHNHTSPDDYYGGDGTGEGIIFQPFIDFSLPRGITISGNKVVGNTVSYNDTSGISSISNLGATIQGNTVTDNGAVKTDPDGYDNVLWPGNGIGVQGLFATTHDTQNLVQNNQVHGNAIDGIQNFNTYKNRFLANTSTGNGTVDGWYGLDLDDLSNSFAFNGVYPAPDCTNNVWSGNIWGTAGYYPDCTTNGGSGPNPPASLQHTASPQAQLPGHGGDDGGPGRHLTPADHAQAQALGG